jgi:hypothetical protein
MSNETDVAGAAKVLLSKDEEALLLEIGLRERAIEADPARAEDPHLRVEYDSTHMGLIDDIKSLGRRIMVRWNKELYGAVCGKKVGGTAASVEDKKMRDDLLKALNLSDAAVIAAVVTALIALGAPAAVAAPVAPYLVKKFIMPAKDELCDAWGEAMTG